MRFEKSYKLTKWTEWNSSLAKNIDDFYVSYSFYPNILEANRYTYSQIDFLINVIPGEKQKLYRNDELLNQRLKPAETEEVGIIAYESDIGNVDFAIDENLAYKEFRLVYDSDPEWEDETITMIPVEDEKLIFNIIGIGV
jgi:hypothetical protein